MLTEKSPWQFLQCCDANYITMSCSCSPPAFRIVSLYGLHAKEYLVLMSFSCLVGQVQINSSAEQFAEVAAFGVSERGQVLVRLRTDVRFYVLEKFSQVLLRAKRCRMPCQANDFIDGCFLRASSHQAADSVGIWRSVMRTS